MRTVLFVAPFLLDATLKFVQAAATIPGIRLVVVTSQGPERVPAGAHHYRVDDATDVGQLVAAARDVAAKTGGIHRVVGILEDIQEQIAAVREAVGVVGPDVATARRFRDKAVMKDTLRAAGLPVARHRLLRCDADAWAFVSEVGYPIVLKPPAGAGCRSTWQVTDPQVLRQALEDARPGPGRETLAEEFVTGEEHSFDTITIRGQTRFYNIGRYYPGPLEVTRNDWIQWCVLLPRELTDPGFADVKRVGPAAVRALGLDTGFTHMEWFRRKDGSAVISEIGARPPGAQFTSLMSWAYDRSLYHAWAEAVIDETLTGPFDRQYSAGIAYLRGIERGRIAAIEGLDEAQARVGKLVVEVRLPHVGAPKSTHYEGDGYVIVRHPDTEVVKHALLTLVETIRVRYA